MSDPRGDPSFNTTRWTVVVAAGSHDTAAAREALGTLCKTYWYPLYCFARRRGASAHTAQDLVQSFLAKAIEQGTVGAADPSRGRFRSFLLTAFRNHMADDWEKQSAAKRGGGKAPLSLDARSVSSNDGGDVPGLDVAAGESRFQSEIADGTTPERLFERRWALDLLATALRRARTEAEATQPAAFVREILPFIGGPGDGAPYAQIAARHGTTPGAVKTAVHRLRSRYREHLRATIRDTVASDADVEDEIRDLLRAVAG
jgi:RNA polymerase sigma factor (sigma-70 family)